MGCAVHARSPDAREKLLPHVDVLRRAAASEPLDRQEPLAEIRQASTEAVWEVPVFHCGEYGERTFRPHYHALIFGLDFEQERQAFKKSGEHTLYRSEALDKVWGHGYVNIGELTFESAAYCARYTLKKAYGQKADVEYTHVDYETGEVFELAHPYCTMSRNPGIGSKWFDKFKSDVFPRDEVYVRGKYCRPPRYYADKLSDPEKERLKAKRRSKSETPQSVRNRHPDRRKARKHILEQQQARLARSRGEGED